MGSPSLKAAALINEAEKWLKVRESGGQNHGPEVEMFQKAITGVASGQPWCMCFAQYCLKQVGGSDVFVSANCLHVWDKSPEELRLVNPEPGCLVIWKHRNTSAGHVGIVKEIISDTQMRTIEGNTSPASIIDRNGDGVYEKIRAIHPVAAGMELVGFLRCWKEPTEVDPNGDT